MHYNQAKRLRDPRYKSNISIGTTVRILSSYNEITGVVQDILSPLEYNPLGITVLLNNKLGSKGQVLEILSTSSGVKSDALNLLSNPESDTLEFKASLLTPVDTIEYFMQKYNIQKAIAEEKLKSVSKNLIYSSMKTIAGFVNTNGGNLFIGVSDQGEILGLESDFQKIKGCSGDGFLIELKNQIKSHYGSTGIFSFIPIMEILEFDEKSVARIAISPSSVTAYPILEKAVLRGHSVILQKYYVRIGNSTEEFTPKDFYENHWPEHCKKHLSLRHNASTT